MYSILLKRKTKLLSVLLMLAMLVALVPMGVLADDTWDSEVVGNLTISVSSGTEALEIVSSTHGENFDIASTDSDYPFSFTLKLSPYTNVSSVAITSTGSGEAVTHTSGDYYLVTLPGDGSSSILTITPTNARERTFYCYPATGGTAGAAGTGIYAYLPAPGQFDNEGIGSGGWGDIYQSGSTNLKTLVDAHANTGVTLGAYGGSAVFDFGESGVDNTATNKYGVDFVLYGNAFSNWSEPGCVQVSQDGSTWYDIAGSRHYMSGTDWDYEQVYANPTPADNTGGTSSLANVPYADKNNVSGSGTQTWSTYGTVATNSYHNHSWFPLARNYFDTTERNATGYSAGGGASGMMANVSALPFATLLEDQDILSGGSTVVADTTTLAFKGVNLNQTQPTTTLYAFGYADVHANGSSYGTSVNPYAATGSSTGGDPIDISWAVNSNGEPVNLSNIRYVRVYTGVMNVSPAFGETSTEVTGIYNANDTGTGAATSDLVVKNGNTVKNHSNMGTTDITTTLTSYSLRIFSDEPYVYVNGADVSGSCSSTAAYTQTVTFGAGENTKYIHVITQNGTESPYVTLFKIVKN